MCSTTEEMSMEGFMVCSFLSVSMGLAGAGADTKTSRPCFQGRDVCIPWYHLSSPAFHSRRPHGVRARGRYPCAVMGAPIIVSAPLGGAVGMRLQGLLDSPGGTPLPEYLPVHPFSAAGTLWGVSRYLLVLFTALSGSKGTMAGAKSQRSKRKTPGPRFRGVVDGTGLEPVTSCTSSRCSTS